MADLIDDQPTIIVAEVGGRTVCFDMRDTSEVDRRFLSEVEFYFKRSLERGELERWKGAHAKVCPLGLNYSVYDNGTDWPAVRRFLQGTGTIGSLARRFGLDVKFQPRVGVFESYPDTQEAPGVLFLTRLWGASRHADSPAGPREREAINEMRIACVRALRTELGDLFTGGIVASDLSRRLAPDLLCPVPLTAKKAYLRLMKSTPICVTTSGLHGSNGWKLGEYTASARAIVCEPLQHGVPGDFAAGKNYLAFSSPEECVQSAVRLVQDRQLRVRMMLRNLNYYQTHVCPEALVLNALQQTAGDARIRNALHPLAGARRIGRRSEAG